MSLTDISHYESFSFANLLQLSLEHDKIEAHVMRCLGYWPSLSEAPFYYVEGWVILTQWPIEHGWLMGPAGEIVDPTLALFGQRFETARYIPGPSFRSIDVGYFYSVEQEVRSGHVTPLSYRSSSALALHEQAKALAYASRL